MELITVDVGKAKVIWVPLNWLYIINLIVKWGTVNTSRPFIYESRYLPLIRLASHDLAIEEQDQGQMCWVNVGSFSSYVFQWVWLGRGSGWLVCREGLLYPVSPVHFSTDVFQLACIVFTLLFLLMKVDSSPESLDQNYIIWHYGSYKSWESVVAKIDRLG